ncbi:MAG: ATP-binding protein [candidate division KSB1 bacterium]|nr:ATP-binding protein [candidate division KSB1 bacterium]MDZ7367174.1 ATP-binding protein [candidate division KSB1 bacterium]MDZ7405343.1 ATP-binding protein [candidate division KSB1 bacterium]
MPFFNREQELEFLNNKYREPGSQLIVIYGKRRVGKTELVKQFFEDKPHLYFLADKLPEPVQLVDLAGKVGGHFRDPLLAERGFGRWEQFFAYLKTKTVGKRLTIIIDEFPYLVESNPAVPSLFQKGWDEYLKDTRVFLILLGSSISMMESQVLGQKAPLYGRRTGQLNVQPFSFRELAAMFPKKNFEERLSYWSVLGGIPLYLSRFDPKWRFFENIRRFMLSKGELLYEEVEFILREELKEPRNYFSILRAIALGKRKMAEIVNETGLPQNVLSKYLSVLRDLRIVTKEIPVTELQPEKSKQGLYSITDNFFKFWFRFIFLNKSLLEEGQTDFVLKKIRNAFPKFLSMAYEEILPEVLKHAIQESHVPLYFPHAGRWWQGNQEIDLVALNPEEKMILFGEAKWTTKPVGTNVFEELVAKSELVEWQKKKRKPYFALFSKRGFTPAMLKLAKERGVFLFHGEKPTNL